MKFYIATNSLNHSFRVVADRRVFPLFAANEDLVTSKTDVISVDEVADLLYEIDFEEMTATIEWDDLRLK